MEGLARRLKLVRHTLGYTQSEMAEKIKVKYRSWQDYENGKNVPGGKALSGIALLGINTNWLLTGHGVMQPSTEVSIASGGLMELVATAIREVVAEMDNPSPLQPEAREHIIKALTRLYCKLSAQPLAESVDHLLQLK